MAIIKAEEAFGKQQEQAQASPKFSPIENQPALFAAQMINSSYNALGNAITRSVGNAVDVVKDAQIAVERTRSKEAQSELELRTQRAKLEVDTEEQEFIKANGRMFTPEEIKQRYSSKVDGIKQDIISRYAFNWIREDVDVNLNDYVEKSKTDYEVRVVHPRAVKSVALSLDNTLRNQLEAARVSYETGAPETEVFAKFGEAIRSLDNPEWVIVHKEGYEAWKEQTRNQITADALKMMKPEDRVKLYEQYKTAPIDAMTTPAGQLMGTRLGGPEFEDMVAKDVVFLRQQEDQKRAAQNRMWEDNQAAITIDFDIAETNALIGKQPFSYNDLKAKLDEARQSGAIGIRQYQQSLAKLNNSWERLKAKEERAQDRAIRAEEVRLQREARIQTQEHAKYGAALDALTDGIAVNHNDPKSLSQAEKYFIEKMGPTLKGLSPEEQQKQTFAFIERTGYVPKVLVAQIEADLTSGDTQRTAAGVIRLEQLSRLSPNVSSRISKTAQGVAELAIAGSAERAATSAKAIQQMAPERRKIIENDSPKLMKGATKAETQTEATNYILRKAGMEGMIPPSAYNAIPALYRDNLLVTNGDADAALELTIKDLPKKYKVTEVNGAKQYLQFTPESEVGAEPGTSEAAVVRKVIRADLLSLGLSEAEIDSGKYVIGNDEATFNPSTSRRTFPVYYRDDAGRLLPALKENADGKKVQLRVWINPEQYRNEFLSEKEQAKMEAEQAQAARDAVAKRRK